MKYSIKFVLIRIFTAVTLFATLGKANVWLDTASNTILALGYRIELVLLPLTFALLGTRALIFSFAVMSGGVVLFALGDKSMVTLLAALLFAYGAAISGFLLKNVAAQSKNGAAKNRMALNAGALMGGLCIMIPFLTPTLFFWCSALILGGCLFLALQCPLRLADVQMKMFRGLKLATLFAWVLMGTTMGMAIFGTFSVLPQTLLETTGTLPVWYGSMVILNSFIIVVAQMPVLKLIELTGRYRVLVMIGLIFMVFGLYILIDIIPIHSFFAAAIWTVLVSISKCTIPHLDYYSARQKALFVKEISVGLGAGLTVFIMRSVPGAYNASVIAVLGISFTLIWWSMTYRQLRLYD
ncbi:MFS transporter [Flexibacterium corallicola]|uniref:hypothetical protein n=1 Tax=Flexibacterium corallicola TaxID=3037259 RepID=UPI00286EC3ED|nr:hypothetical protein [Pseudovibrio sp. M1P-2-3]